MICKPCRERNHGACLTLYPPFSSVGIFEEWKPRDEMSLTWCDCQHKTDDFLTAIEHRTEQMLDAAVVAVSTVPRRI